MMKIRRLFKKDKEGLLPLPTFPVIIKLQPRKFSGVVPPSLPACKPRKRPFLVNHLSTTSRSLTSSLH